MAEKTKQDKKQGMDNIKEWHLWNIIKSKALPKINIRLQKDISRDTLETFLRKIG